MLPIHLSTWNWPLLRSRIVLGVWLCTISNGFAYDKITMVERDTWETSPVHCCTLITIPSNELTIFPGIAFYYGNKKTTVFLSFFDHSAHFSSLKDPRINLVWPKWLPPWKVLLKLNANRWSVYYVVGICVHVVPFYYTVLPVMYSTQLPPWEFLGERVGQTTISLSATSEVVWGGGPLMDNGSEEMELTYPVAPSSTSLESRYACSFWSFTTSWPSSFSFCWRL